MSGGRPGVSEGVRMRAHDALSRVIKGDDIQGDSYVAVMIFFVIME